MTGGTADHVHSLVSLARTQTIADVVEEVKKSSSKWMKDQGVATFFWQAGYGAFSIGESQVSAVVRYIARQEKHHQHVSFQEEFRRFLAQYGVAYDERYVVTEQVAAVEGFRFRLAAVPRALPWAFELLPLRGAHRDISDGQDRSGRIGVMRSRQGSTG